MSAETLRRAAALMRERAEADGTRGWQVEDANEGTDYFPLWMVTNDAFHNPPADEDEPWLAVEVHTGTKATAEHIASWHPAVALAVADWLDSVTCGLHCNNRGMRAPYCWACEDSTEDHDCPPPVPCEHTRDFKAALAVARAYLGEA